MPDVLAAAFFEGLQRGFVVAGDPEGFVQVDGFVLHGSAVFMLQAVLDDVELERTDAADDLGVVYRAGEELGDAFVHQLIDAFGELLRFERIAVVHPAELLGAEARDALEVQLLPFRQRIADLEVAGVVEADYVAREGLVHHFFFGGHEAGWVGKLHLTALAYVQVVRVALESAGADAQEGDPVAVARVHIGVNLEDEAGELVFVGQYLALLRWAGARLGGDLHEAVQQLLHAKVVDGGAEKDRADGLAQVFFTLEFGVYFVDHLHLFAQFVGGVFADELVQFRVFEVIEFDGFFGAALFVVGPEEDEALLKYVVNALETFAHADGPAQGRAGELEFLLYLIQQVETFLTRPVHFIDEDDDGGLAHAADFDEFFGLFLHPFRDVDHDDHGVYGGQRPVSVFGEVFVAGRIQDVDLLVFVVEGHHGGRHGDTPLAFDLHKIGGRALLDFIALHRAGDLDGTTKQQQLFGQRGLTGIRVGNDAEGAAAGYFLFLVTHAGAKVTVGPVIQNAPSVFTFTFKTVAVHLEWTGPLIWAGPQVQRKLKARIKL